MKKRLLAAICCLSVLAMNVSPLLAQTEFKNAVTKKYDLKYVSCYTCHSKKSELPEDKHEAYSENSRQFRNKFGMEFDKHLKGKKVTARLKAVKTKDPEDPERVKVTEEVTADFFKALAEVEKVKSPSGKTYGELLKSATLDGVKPKE